jgi:hypothetical protein
MTPASFTDEQLQQLMAITQPLPPILRTTFLKHALRVLGPTSEAVIPLLTAWQRAFLNGRQNNGQSASG